MVGDEHAVETVLPQNPQHPNMSHHFVNERLLVVWHLASDIAEVNVGEFALFAVVIEPFS